MSKLLLLILIFRLVDADPVVLDLMFPFIYGDRSGLEAGARLYLASNDNNDYLKNIRITSGNASITLDQINFVDQDGPLPYFVLNDGLTVSTSNSESVTKQLTGYIYVTTKEQANDSSFSVYVLKKSHRIATTSPKSTVVVLNVQLHASNFETPDMNSYITGIDQSPNTNLTFNWGYPEADWLNSAKKEFFRNPLYLNNSDSNGTYSNTKKRFFDNVDDLQVSMPFWYFIVDGPITMNISNYYETNYNYTTKYVNTTGLIISLEPYFHSHEVNFQLDLSRSRTVGTLTTTILGAHTVNFTFSDINGKSLVKSYTDQRVFQELTFTEMQASKLFVSSNSIAPGQFFCQYFVFSGDLTTIETTTKSIGSPSILSSTLVFIFSLFFLF